MVCIIVKIEENVFVHRKSDTYFPFFERSMIAACCLVTGKAARDPNVGIRRGKWHHARIHAKYNIRSQAENKSLTGVRIPQQASGGDI